MGSDPDWMTLESEIGMPTSQVTSMGMRGTNEAALLKQGGSTGFEALLGGFRNTNGSFAQVNDAGIFATSSNFNSSTALIRQLFSSNNQILRQNNSKLMGISVRCIKD